MSEEKRFEFYSDEYFIGVLDTVTGRTFNSLGIVDLLNDLYEERNYFERKKCEYWNKFNLAHLDNINLQEENEQLKRQNKALKDNSLTDAYFNYLENSRTVTLKVAEESETFKFNKNCAKPYEIRSISPNGVVRVGKKNSKVSWRMKDVREISQELPPFEDFNREIFQQIKNKFHTKFDNDVIGRIIYNIYIGTFEEYI